jgi:hypothetical protein
MQDAHMKLIKSLIAMEKAIFNKKYMLFTSKLFLYLRKTTSEMLYSEHNLVDAGTVTFWKIDQKYLDSFEN